MYDHESATQSSPNILVSLYVKRSVKQASGRLMTRVGVKEASITEKYDLYTCCTLKEIKTVFIRSTLLDTHAYKHSHRRLFEQPCQMLPLRRKGKSILVFFLTIRLFSLLKIHVPYHYDIGLCTHQLTCHGHCYRNQTERNMHSNCLIAVHEWTGPCYSSLTKIAILYVLFCFFFTFLLFVPYLIQMYNNDSIGYPRIPNYWR